jgi:di/tricarboxylate transporter
MWLVLGILFAAVILFVTEWLRVDVVALGVVVALMLLDVLTVDEALSGFSNAAVLTIASLFIVGGGVLQTGLAGAIGRQILAIAGTGEIRLTVVLMAAVALLSSFMSDTGTVAVLLPAIIILSRSAGLRPSKLLIPLSYGALLGGASTLIGTPPNLIVSDLLAEQGLEPFTFFDFTPMGVILIASGIGFMFFIGRQLLPDRRALVEGQRVETPKELIDRYRLPEDLYRLRVRRNARLVGETIATARLGEAHQITVLEILRLVEPRPRFRLGDPMQWGLNERDRIALKPEPDTTIEVDDILIVQGEADDVSHAAAVWNLGVQPAPAEDEGALIDEEVGVAEVLLPPRSSLVGHTLVNLNFGRTYGLTVLGINRPGHREKVELKDAPLQFGDILLVQGPWKNILALKVQRRDFVIIGQPEAMIGAPNRSKALTALVILAGMLILMVSNAIPVATASMLAALAMVLSGCLSMDEAYQSVDWRSVVLVAGMLPMSIALEKVALVDLAAQALVDRLGASGPPAVLVGLFVLTSISTQVLSNTATTVVIAPIALAAAVALNVRPEAFLMSVAIAASMAFASPVASPVNTLVMGAGDYHFGDYIKVGLPMILLTLIASALFLPLLWPFF